MRGVHRRISRETVSSSESWIDIDIGELQTSRKKRNESVFSTISSGLEMDYMCSSLQHDVLVDDTMTSKEESQTGAVR